MYSLRGCGGNHFGMFAGFPSSKYFVSARFNCVPVLLVVRESSLLLLSVARHQIRFHHHAASRGWGLSLNSKSSPAIHLWGSLRANRACRCALHFGHFSLIRFRSILSSTWVGLPVNKARHVDRLFVFSGSFGTQSFCADGARTRKPMGHDSMCSPRQQDMDSKIDLSKMQA